MKFAAIAALLIALSVVILTACGKKPLQRGLIDSCFVSNARPVFALIPVSGLKPVYSAVTDISPEGDSGFPQARAWFALYSGKNTAAAVTEAGSNGSAPLPLPGEKARLAVILAEAADGTYRWDTDLNRDITPLYTHSQTLGPFTAELASYILPANAPDPLNPCFTPGPQWEKGSLVRRFSTLPGTGEIKLIIEYREPLPAALAQNAAPQSPVPLSSDAQDAVDAFQRRALAAFELSTALPEGAISTLESPAGEFSRSGLGRMAGLMRRYIGD